MFGGDGDDSLFGGAGDDTLDGGAGIDEVDFSLDTSGVIVDLDYGLAIDGSGETDSLTGIENISGSRFNDDLTGDYGVNEIRGGDGDDLIFGGFGADSLFGEAGNDAFWYTGQEATINGGAGDDIVIADLYGISLVDGTPPQDDANFPYSENDATDVLREIEGILLADSESTHMYLDAASILKVTDSRNTLVVEEAFEFGENPTIKSMDAIGTWTLSEAQETDGVDYYNVYTATVEGETVTLKVDTDIEQSSISGTINLADLDGSNGFLMMGEDAGDLFGVDVSDAGDVNGDGFADIIVGASSVGNSRAAYVIFGKADGFSLVESIAAVAAGDGSTGFELLGENNGDQAGIAVSGAGDVNGDGFADVIVGAQTANSNTGAAYIVFGAASFTNSSYALGALSSNGFIIDGSYTNEGFGASVAAAVDIDGDGFDDVIIGAPGYSSQTGRAYILYGSSGLGSDITTSGLGEQINGIDSSDEAGYRVDGIGDINGDGHDDVLISAPSKS